MMGLKSNYDSKRGPVVKYVLSYKCEENVSKFVIITDVTEGYGICGDSDDQYRVPYTFRTDTRRFTENKIM